MSKKICLPNLAFCRYDNGVSGNAEMIIQIINRCRGTKSGHADKAVGLAKQPIPALTQPSLNSNARRLAKHLLAVGTILHGKKIKTRHRNNSSIDAAISKLFLRLNGNANFGS